MDYKTVCVAPVLSQCAVQGGPAQWNILPRIINTAARDWPSPTNCLPGIDYINPFLIPQSLLSLWSDSWLEVWGDPSLMWKVGWTLFAFSSNRKKSLNFVYFSDSLYFRENIIVCSRLIVTHKTYCCPAVIWCGIWFQSNNNLLCSLSCCQPDTCTAKQQWEQCKAVQTAEARVL